MNTSPLALALLASVALWPAHAALAHERSTVTINSGRSRCCEEPARWAERHDAREARFAITTEDGDATLMLTREVVAMQLSDRAFHKIDRKIHETDGDGEDSPLGDAIKRIVLEGVREMLNHSAECRIRDIRDIEYRDDSLVITTEDGQRLFDGVEINDEDTLQSFSERDARAFVREFRRAKAALK
jgi:hypothetical protein